MNPPDETRKLLDLEAELERGFPSYR